MDANARREVLRLTLEGHPEAASEARNAVAAIAGPHLPPDREPDLAVLVSEVVTNAIVHGDPGGVIEIRASRASDALRVEVTDHGPGLASTPQSTTSAPGGDSDYSLSSSSRADGG